MKSYSYRTIIEPDDPKGYHGFVPSLPGVHTCGDTIEEVQKSLRDAIKCHLQGFIKDNKTIPEEIGSLEMIYSFTPEELSKKYA
ncbi:MAG: type II toxin-antitoxin system HicB family antitoxin [Patescibacteria group bacterium]